MYGRRGVVSNLAHASMLLGINRLRNAVLGMSLARLWNQVKTPPDWSNARFNLHSVGTALLSDLLAQRVSVDFAEGAFLGGLFHDVGKLLIVVGLGDEYQRVSNLYEQGTLSWLDCEREILGFTHPELSAAAVAKWRLPDAIRAAVLDHHLEHPSTSEPRENTYSLATVVRCADVEVNRAGISVRKERSPAEPSQLDPLSLLSLEQSTPEILEEFKAQYDSLTAFFR